MSRGADFRGVLLKSLGLAILCTLFTVPYFHHLLSVSFKAQDRFLMSSDFYVVLITELFLLFITCFLSAIVVPGMGGRPLRTIRVGSPAVWVSMVEMIRLNLTMGQFLLDFLNSSTNDFQSQTLDTYGPRIHQLVRGGKG